MPELPEVETVRRDLEPLAGQRLDKIIIHDARVWFESELKPNELSGAVLRALRRRGKYIIYDFGKIFLVQHLRMTGKMLPAGSSALPKKIKDNLQVRAEFRFGKNIFYFFDTRRFGTLTAVNDIEKFWQKKQQAPDSFAADESRAALSHFLAAIAHRERPIKSALLDQSLISGVGNIYADEVLHRLGIHPQTPARELSPDTIHELFRELHAIFSHAIQARGTSAINYLGVNGKPGEFAQFLRVYDREGEKCLRCGSAHIKTLKLAGRTSHFCPNCQPLIPKSKKQRRKNGTRTTARSR